ncbi:membrane protein of ER body 2 isoform X2 [Eutrema salsugineum]|uniref:membrane protein of ER body 2 isoform X2 n=1 Tax=Eutrema salsugineum TaxID=72664 RepID=UPI000CED32FB|nr:membrane protein of ER body 2 isoform X2 [Eutrema salsugineum]
MEKLDRPVNGDWFGESEIVDADLLVNLLEAYRFGKDNVPAGKIRFKAEVTAPPDNTTEMQGEEDDDGSQGLVGNTSVHESMSSVSSNSDPIILDTTSETGSDNEPGSNEESGNSWLESNSTNLPNAENERQRSTEEGEVEEECEIEEEKEANSERSSSEPEEKSDLEKLLAIQENYELYCPSCSSCITRKVILKKKKHEKLGDLSANLKSDVHVVNESSEIEEIEPPVKVHVPETRNKNDDQEDKKEGFIFTCLACLKHFLRSGVRILQLDYVREKPVDEPEASKSSSTTEPPAQNKPDGERLAIELLKSTVYGGLSETITSLGVVSSASAAGSSTENILALAVANLAGGLIVLAQNLQDLRNSSEQEKDRYEELLGRRANIRMHILVAVLSYIFFGLIPPLVYAFSFYETGIKNYKLVSVFSVSLVCVILLGMVKVYVRKPPNLREPPKSYLKSAAYYTSVVVASSGITYVVGDIVGGYIGKLGWFSLDQIGLTSTFDRTKTEEYRFTNI